MHKVFDALARHADETPERVAVRSTDGRMLSYGGLAKAVSTMSTWFPEHAGTVAIGGTPSFAWIVADLAASLAGRRVVPLPVFFGAQQLAHVMKDAQVDHVIDCEPMADFFPAVPTSTVLRCSDDAVLVNEEEGVNDLSREMPVYLGGADRVIYTSGTTGQPKGVVHGDQQLGFAIPAIGEAVGADAGDRHLSLLPPALLLEQIAGIFLPILLGAEMILAPDACLAALKGDIAAAARALDMVKPTTTILVPQQLQGLVRYAEATGWRPPESLRMVAVGGAPLAADVLAAARRIGLPVRYGYGLSECCSVVAVARDEGSDVMAGAFPTVGYPIEGTDVRIEGGEIVVRSPGVMTGYLGKDRTEKVEWRTGDVGYIDANGRLTVLGRKDRLIVLANGRNISPEWIENIAKSVPWIADANVSGHGADRISLTLSVYRSASSWLDGLSRTELLKRLAALFEALPDYARPGRVSVKYDDPSEGAFLIPDLEFAAL